MFHDFVHFPKLFQSVELVNVWNNCVATVELNCGVTVDQKSAKNSFSVPHYGKQILLRGTTMELLIPHCGIII